MVGRSWGDRNPDPNPSPNQAVLQGAFVGYLNRLKPLTLVRELTKAEIVRSNLAHAAVSRALSIRADLEALRTLTRTLTLILPLTLTLILTLTLTLTLIP